MAPSNLKEALAAGTHTIGYLTWYDCRDAKITPQQLKFLFNKHGLVDQADGTPHPFFPEDIKPKNAFQKACRKAMTETSTTSDTRRSITKLIIDGMNKIVYGVVDLDINEAKEEIDPDFSDRVWLDKGSLGVVFDHGHPTSKRIKAIYDQLCGEYITRDISRMIVRAFDRMCVVSLRAAGVVYFVPEAFTKDLQALQAVVNDIGSCNMQIFAIGDGGNNATSVEKAAKSQIADKISTLKSDIADLKQSIEDGIVRGKSADNSIDVRIRRFREIKEKCSILADALKIKAESLEGELDSVRNLLKTELNATV